MDDETINIERGCENTFRDNNWEQNDSRGYFLGLVLWLCAICLEKESVF